MDQTKTTTDNILRPGRIPLNPSTVRSRTKRIASVIFHVDGVIIAVRWNVLHCETVGRYAH